MSKKKRPVGHGTIVAHFMSCGLCEDHEGEHVGVNMFGDDGDLVCHGHLDLVGALEFLTEYSFAVHTLRTAQGKKPS